MDALKAKSGIAACDAYLANGYNAVVGMSSQFAAGVTCGLLRIQSAAGVTGPVVEVGAFEGRFLIALAKSLAPGEHVLGIDLFDWPNPEVEGRCIANCDKYGVPKEARDIWKTDSRKLTPQTLLTRLGGKHPRLQHIDGEHSRQLLSNDLELATAVMDPAGILVLDDMLHPGYPTLMVAVHEYLERHPEMCVLAIIDRETIVAATKFVLCRKDWFKRYEDALLAEYRDNVWPLGADFEPHWCLVLSLDTRLAAIT